MAAPALSNGGGMHQRPGPGLAPRKHPGQRAVDQIDEHPKERHKRMKMNASHSVYVSQPEAVATLIETAAKAVS